MSLLGMQREKKSITESFRGIMIQADLFQMREKFASITIGQN